MQSRTFADEQVTEIGLGCWQLGGDWGQVTEDEALEILRHAYDQGVRFLDTAAGYGSGRSERLIGRFLRELGPTQDPVFVATKISRPPPSTDDLGEHLRRLTHQSLENLGVDALDLTQLHCYPPELLEKPEVWETLREMRAEGLIRHFGASVESVDEARFCTDQPGLASLQLIFSILRQHVRDEVFDLAKRRGIAIIVRLPLASGLLSGKMNRHTEFEASDHRHYNRDGGAFHVGETFAGLPFEKGVDLAERVRAMLPSSGTMAQGAIRWVLDHEAVTVVIPGASHARQAVDNAEASTLPPLEEPTHQQLAAFYRDEVAPHVRGRH